MAKNPNVGEDPLQVFYGDPNCVIKKLEIQFVADKSEKQGRLKCLYHILSEEDRTAFLFSSSRFFSYYYSNSYYYGGYASIKVNGQAVEMVDFQKGKLPPYVVREVHPLEHLKKERDTTYYIATPERIELGSGYELQGFFASLKKGENLIEVELEDYDLNYLTNEFIGNVNFISDFLPLHYWKSVEEIELVLTINQDKIKFQTANIGQPTIYNNSLKWTLKQIPNEEVQVVFREDYPLITRFFVAISPIGIAGIFFLVLCWWHFRQITKPNARRLVLWLGIFAVPIVAYTIFVCSFSFLEWLLGKDVYSSEIIFALTYPIFQLVYLLVMLVIFYERRKKRRREDKC